MLKQNHFIKKNISTLSGLTVEKIELDGARRMSRGQSYT